MPATLTASDALVFSDHVILALGNPFTRAAGDNLLLSDSAQFLVNLLSNPSDFLLLSDHLQIQRLIALTFSDSLNLSDNVGAPVLVVEIELSISDSLFLSDSPSVVPSTALDEYLRRYLNDVS